MLGHPENSQRRPALFHDTPSPIEPTTSSFIPPTPGLLSEPEYDPLSSPETVLSTPQSSFFEWQPVSGPYNLLEANDPVSPIAAHAQAQIKHALEALQALKVIGMSPFELLDIILNLDYHHQQTAFFRRDLSLIPRLLTHLFENSTGHQVFQKWLPPTFVRDSFCDRVSKQMEAAKPFFQMNAESFSVDYCGGACAFRNLAA